jgi:hypothetical protein
MGLYTDRMKAERAAARADERTRVARAGALSGPGVPESGPVRNGA